MVGDITATIEVEDNIIGVMRVGESDYISLTDLARHKNLDNPGDVIIKWMSNKSSFDFYCLWEELNNENFKLAESREFKKDSASQSFTMSPSRWINKTNYRIHTDSIKNNLVPVVSEQQKMFVYASEADVINVALFGITAKMWHEKNPELVGNVRDHANILQLIILSNLEVLNANMINEGIEQADRIKKLNNIARKEYELLTNNEVEISNLLKIKEDN